MTAEVDTAALSATAEGSARACPARRWPTASRSGTSISRPSKSSRRTGRRWRASCGTIRSAASTCSSTWPEWTTCGGGARRHGSRRSSTSIRCRATSTCASRCCCPTPRARGFRRSHPRLAGRRLVRAGGLRPLRLRVRGTPEPAPPSLPRRLRRPPPAQGLRAGPALVRRPRRTCSLARLDRGDRRARRPLRDPDDLDRAVAPGHPRHRAPDRAAGRRADRRAPKRRSDTSTAASRRWRRRHTWNQVIPVHRPAELRLGDDQRRRLRAGRSRRCSASRSPTAAVLVRTILSEFSRIMDHCVDIGANLVDIGALTNFWYLYQPREEIYGLLEACCGARLTVSYVRVGGLADRRAGRLRGRVAGPCSSRSRSSWTTWTSSSRTTGSSATGSRGPASSTREQAVAWGFTGPMLRASGVPYDVRAVAPLRLLRQVRLGRADLHGRGQLRPLPRPHGGDAPVAVDHPAGPRRHAREGPVNSDDWHVVLPPKDAVYHDMESLIYHFKLVMEGIRVPPGERYEWIEGANGELGFYAICGRGRRALPPEGAAALLPDHGGLREDRSWAARSPTPSRRSGP